MGFHGWFSQPLLSHQSIKIAKAIAGRRGATGAAAGVVAAGVLAYLVICSNFPVFAPAHRRTQRA